MSRTVDERVVGMQFDNRDFERNVNTTLGTIGKLKNALNLSGATKGLENVDAASKKVNFESLLNAIEPIKVKFSALEAMATGALMNIGATALRVGSNVVSAFTIDPIKDGFNEYETQLNAVQTILANTKSKGSTLDDVNAALAELNTYADKTIYNFTEMTRNIGTFTAAGVDLETSVSSIKGIANLAAMSGSDSQKASMAMYQLSQALAAGKVQLMDWNSVVNAGMGGEQFQTALIRTSELLGTGAKAAIDANGTFRESLTKSGWLTTEVLTETLKQISGAYTEADLLGQGYSYDQAKAIVDMAETATGAATEIKTFTGLMDTLKESVGSGWASTWMILMGNFEEAKQLWTGIGTSLTDSVGKMSDARNKLLQDWKNLGGRNNIIDGITNSVKGLLAIIAPIKEAFRDIFPPITAEQLAKITSNFKELTEKFKIGDETADKIKRTFKGLFALIDIGKEAFKSLGVFIEPIVTGMLALANIILNVTAVFGDWIVGIRDAIKESKLFTSVFESIGNTIEPITTFIKNAITSIVNAFNELGSADFKGFDDFSKKIEVGFKPFTTIAEFFKGVFKNLVGAIEFVSKYIGIAFTKLSDGFSNAMNDGSFNNILSFINGGLLTSIIIGLKKIIDNLTDLSKGGGFLQSITNILDGVADSLKAYQTKLKAETLKSIAIAIAILAGALFVLAMIDPEKLTSSLVAITAMFIELFASMAIFEKAMGGDKFKSLGKVARAMILISTAVLILAVAMKQLSDLDWGQIARGLTSVAVLSGILVGTSKLLEKESKGLIKTSTGLIIFATALNVLAGVVKKLGEIDPDKLGMGLLGVGILCAELAAFLKVADLDGMGLLKGLGLMALAGAVSILSNAVSVFAEMDINKLMQGIGAVLAELVLFTRFTGDPKHMITTAIGLNILGASMLIFAEAVNRMGSIPINEIGKGLLGMAGTLLIVAGAIKLLPKKGMISTGIGLLAIAGALAIINNVMTNLGGMQWDEIGRGLTVLAGALILIVGAVNLMSGALLGAAALVVVAGALAILTPVIKSLGQMSLTEIGKGLLALGGAFAVIGVAGLLLTPLAVPLLALGGAIALLGIGCLAAGIGILAFSAGLSALAVSGGAGVAVIIMFIKELIALIPYTLTKIGEGIVAFAGVIKDGAPALLEAFVAVVSSLIDSLVELTPKIVDALVTLILYLLDVIVENLPKFIDAGVSIILSFLKGISDNIEKFVEAGKDIVMNFIKGVTENTQEAIDAGFDLMIAFITGLTDTINEKTPVLVEAIKGLMDALIDAGIETLKLSVYPYKKVGSEIMESGFITGISSKVSSMKEAIGTFISTGVENIKAGIADFKLAGSQVIDGFISGFSSKISEAASWASSLGSSIIESARNVLGIASPSKEFKEIGRYSIEGLVIGLRKYTNVATAEAGKVGEKTLASLNNSIDFEGLNSKPTIRPVIDMTDVKKGTNAINSLFGRTNLAVAGFNTSVAGSSAMSISGMMKTNQNGTNDDIVSAIKDLKSIVKNNSGNNYTINGITYDDGSNITDAVKTLVRAAKIERRM